MKKNDGSAGRKNRALLSFKTIMVMRNILIIMFLSTLQLLASESYSQNARLSLNLQNVSIESVLDDIERQSEFCFVFNYKLVDVKRQVDIKAENEPISDILASIFADADVDYLLLDRQIVLSPRKYLAETKSRLQSRTITGMISDVNGEPLIGANIVVKGSVQGTITDMNGNYTLDNVPDGATLVFSYLGMVPQELPVENKTLINVVLQEEIYGIEEVVAVGYGTMSRGDLTGSVSKVKSEDIAAYPSIGILQSLQGRAAGVQIQSNNGAEPGASIKVRIRGATSINSSSDPLYVVDGFPGATMPPPEDIESVEVLKDASATAIYGSRGANGVVLITTKQGREGKTKIELNTSYSMQKEIKRLDLLTRDDFIDYITEIKPTFLQDALIGPGTDWQDEVLRTGNIRNHQLSFSGGNDQLKYYVSGILYDQDGIIINSGYKRYSVTSNLKIKATEKINFGFNLYTGRSSSEGIPTQQIRQSSGVIAAAYQAAPTLPVYDENGIYAVSTLSDPSDNPVAILNEYRQENMDDIIQANFFGEYRLLPGLVFRVTLGTNVRNGRYGTYASSKLVGNDSGKAQMGTNKNTDVINENYLTYNKKFGVHELNFMGGYSYQSSTWEGLNALNRNFLTDAFYWWDLAGGSDFSVPSSNLGKSELSSFYGRINYKLWNRYLVTFNARYDGSSRFAKNNKWAFFPSGAIAWNIAEESFMDNVTQISQLKLRGSYGITGNQAIGAYQSLAKLTSVHSIQNSAVVNAVVPSAVANDNLTWESTAQTDVGLDLGLFDQKILLVMDYYYKKTSDLLFNMPLPEYSGYGSMLKNIGSLQNQGFEITLSTQNLNRELKWTTDVNFSLNRNK
ncbi:MAG: TonB-dependent receptor, partial [Bacteroidota bacterium]